MKETRSYLSIYLMLSVVGLCIQFISSQCLINTRSLTDDRQPLILLASTLSWYPLTFSDRGTINVPENVSLTLVCPRSSNAFNSFEQFYKENEITAKCIAGENFNVRDETYAFKDLQCLYSLKPTLKVTNLTCLAPNTFNDTSLEHNWVKIFVGYPTNTSFIPVYEVCFDRMKVGTLYSLSTIEPEIERNEFPVRDIDWISDNELYGYLQLDTDYICQRQANTFYGILGRNYFNDPHSCCFLKSKLVNDADLIYRPQQIAAYHYVNTVPQCHKENWQEVSKRVRTLSSNLNRPLTVWTGVYRTIKRAPQAARPGALLERDLYLYYKSDLNKAQPVPFLSWKIIYDGHTEKALAVVTINDSMRASLTISGLVYCQDVCGDLVWMNFADRKNIDYGYTYCCELDSFLKAFAFTKNNFPKAPGGLLDVEKPAIDKTSQY